ncbi:DUF5013 domain-containing protein [Mucilaginibacter paludis]|uniref:DUF5013 domain-containing protein n=1 Tax=Mucilaginibacter paludis DSM 18603 TaxID=714943 RepID=H1Y4T3_9SPHI|nr:DUF5013 domain-containing protein [Mucilaginibacter paludis]EHQ28127.1 hypothetical protein Mucpa_4036 [Mucilaginibacter paludis DSM 18603]
MKFKNTLWFAVAVIVSALQISSCKKDASQLSYGFSMIYMPQSILKSGGVNNNYPVPSGTDSSTYNYVVDQTKGKVNVILGVSVSGPGKDGYGVDIKTNSDTVRQLFTSGVIDTVTYKLMPDAMYTLPSHIDIASGSTAGTFYLSIDLATIKKAQYTGKKMVLAVSIANPSKYALNKALATTIVIIDVDALVIGPANDITSKYIQNPGNNFIASSMDAGGRWGTLASWTTNAAALSHNGKGGYATDGDGINMDLESGWGSPQILNGKIYQTITLPAGSYTFDIAPFVWQGTKDVAYVVVAPNSTSLPDYSAIPGNTGINYAPFTNSAVSFKLTASTQVTVGVVVNYTQDQQGFKTHGVHLYNYPKHL